MDSGSKENFINLLNNMKIFKKLFYLLSWKNNLLGKLVENQMEFQKDLINTIKQINSNILDNNIIDDGSVYCNIITAHRFITTIDGVQINGALCFCPKMLIYNLGNLSVGTKVCELENTSCSFTSPKYYLIGESIPKYKFYREMPNDVYLKLKLDTGELVQIYNGEIVEVTV